MTETNPYSTDTESKPQVEQGLQDDHLPPLTHTSPGWFYHVPLLGTLLFLHGLAEIGFACFWASVAIHIPSNVAPGTAPPNNAYGPFLLSCLLCLWLFVLGVFRLVSGISLRQFRGRSRGLTALVLGPLTGLAGCVCFPSATGLAVYGAMVLLNAQVRTAFELRSAGYSVESIRLAFQARRPIQGLVNESEGLVNESEGLVNESDGLVNESGEESSAAGDSP